jgi:hypothetical protein
MMTFLKCIRKRVRRQSGSRPMAMTKRRRFRAAVMVERWTPFSQGKLAVKGGWP